MIVTSEEKRTLANAYALMMASDAWLDLERFMIEERTSSMRRIDDKSAASLSLGEVCEERGIRKGIIKILQHAAQRKEGV